jgi:flavorubredoxin
MLQFGFRPRNTRTIQHGEVLDLGGMTLHFVAAPMVHWPEVMMTYIPSEKTLFSADAFGSFGVYHAHSDNWTDEARRYYTNICGKYGAQVSAAMNKLQSFDIQTIAPLHGCVLEGHQVHDAWRLYDAWSNYRPECSGVLIAHASIHGHTAAIAIQIAEQLRTKGVEVALIDLCRDDVSEAISQAFKYDKMVLCAASYDAGVFPPMYVFLYKLVTKGYQSRRVALVENGTWAPTAGKSMHSMLSSMKDIEIVWPMLTIRSAWKEEYRTTLNELMKELMKCN